MPESPLVSIVMGSDSDLEIMNEAAKALDDFGISYEIDVTSAHRSPARTAEFARTAASRGVKVIIAGAGGAFGGSYCRRDDTADNWCAHPLHPAERHGFPISNRTDAGRHTRGHGG